MGNAFAGRTVLVPAARVGLDLLAAIVRRQGAEVRSFPHLTGRAPRDPGPLERAVAGVAGFDWLVFAGKLGASRFLDLWGQREPLPVKVAAIGKGARGELRTRVAPPDVAPAQHTADAVADALGDVAGARVLLVRGNQASNDLPAELERRGAKVTDVVGFEIVAEATVEQARAALAPPLDMVAFGSPSAVRFFLAAAGSLELDLARCLGGAVVAAVGPATARIATERGLPPDLVAGGHLAALATTLRELWGVGS